MAELEPLRINQEEGCSHHGDAPPATLKVYPSSTQRADTHEPLLSVLMHNENVRGGIGLRLTREQAIDLMEYLSDWAWQ